MPKDAKTKTVKGGSKHKIDGTGKSGENMSGITDEQSTHVQPHGGAGNPSKTQGPNNPLKGD